MTRRTKFTASIDRDLLADFRNLAKSEGRHIQVLVEEAFARLIEERQQSTARPHVAAAYKASHTRFRSFYEKLAK
jgi:hypothetical protein